MLPDYYTILGIQPSADPDTIRRAYRHQATRHHPDRGGSHERMVEINEAWHVLSNPGKRAEYDKARRSAAPPASVVVAEQNTYQAKQEAEHYPRQWEEFETWMDSFVKDFANARYGTTESGFPTVINSVSGSVFIIAGGIIGFAVGATIFFVVAWPNPVAQVIAFRFLLFGSPVVGCICGKVIHQMIRAGLLGFPPRPVSSDLGGREGRTPRRGPPPPPPPPARSTPPPVPQAEATQVIACPACDHKLRLPQMPNEITVTCRTCQHSFSWN